MCVCVCMCVCTCMCVYVCVCLMLFAWVTWVQLVSVGVQCVHMCTIVGS